MLKSASKLVVMRNSLNRQMRQQGLFRALNVFLGQASGEFCVAFFAGFQNAEVFAASAFHAVAHDKLGADLAFDAVNGVVGDFLEELQVAGAIKRLEEIPVEIAPGRRVAGSVEAEKAAHFSRANASWSFDIFGTALRTSQILLTNFDTLETDRSLVIRSSALST
jgi:hypothetical protein